MTAKLCPKCWVTMTKAEGPRQEVDGYCWTCTAEALVQMAKAWTTNRPPMKLNYVRHER